MSHDARLRASVHPSDWPNPRPRGRYNLVVLGGGPAGLVCALGAAGLGARVALVERHHLGGDCLNVGCVPSKTLIASARAAAALRDAGRIAVAARHDAANAPLDVDFAAVMDRVRRVRADLAPHDSAARLRSLGVDVFFGHARFLARDAVDAGGARLRFSRAVIATGARAVVPAGFEGARTHETIFDLTARPGRLLVVGAGPMGCELAQAFARLGTSVTLVGPTLLPREDRDAARVLRQALERDGMDLRLGTRALRMEPGRALLERDGIQQWTSFDEVLVGAGRVPTLEGLDLERAGIAHDRHGIRVDDHLRTTNPRVYAAGDVCLQHRFTHAADAAARMVIQNALFHGRKRVSSLVIPWCTYTSPEIAHVGSYDGDVIDIPLADVDRAHTDGATEGFVKIHHRRGRILGATLVSEHAGEIITELTLAISRKVSLPDLATVIHPYPTVAECIRKAADAYNRTRLTPPIRALLRWYLRAMALR